MIFAEVAIYLLLFSISTLTFTAYLMRSMVVIEKRRVIDKNLPMMIVVTCAAAMFFIPNLSFINGVVGVIALFIAPVVGVSLIISLRNLKK